MISFLYERMMHADPAVIWGLIGVILGFVLSEASSVLHHRIRLWRLKKALRAECESAVAQIPQLVDILDQCMASLKQKQILPGPAVKAISTVYGATITELAPYLSTKERNLLHVAYERLRVGDEILASYAADLLNALKEKVMGDPWQAYIDRITGQIDSYKVVRELLRSYLDGELIDVFHLNLSEDERKRVSFR